MDPTVEAADGARAECTWNMYSMVVTLDVSKLSGWLNTVALCRVKGKYRKRGGMWAGRREGVGWRRREQGRTQL